MTDLTRDVAAYWAANRAALTLGALALVALAVAIAVIRAVRKGHTDRLISFVTGVAVLGLSAEGMWMVATERLGLPVVVAASVFFVAEAMMVNSARAARRHMDRRGYPGKHGRAVWIIAAAAGGIVALNAHSIVEFFLRLALPLGWAYLWWNTLTEDQEADAAPPASWRWTPRRLLLWLGAIEPGDRDLVQVNRDRQIAALVELAHRMYRGSGRRAEKAGRRLERLALSASRDVLEDAAAQVALSVGAQSMLVPSKGAVTPAVPVPDGTAGTPAEPLVTSQSDALARGTGTAGQHPVPRRVTRSIGTAVPRVVGSGTKTAMTSDGTPTGTLDDTDLLRVLRNPERVEREGDGTVPIKRAMKALGTGRDRAIRLLRTEGLLREPVADEGSETPVGTPANGHSHHLAEVRQ